LQNLYTELHFAYLEINQLVVKNDLSGVYILNLAAMLDFAAELPMSNAQWTIL
jgi:succinyl-CoA synthetase beta subunit